MEFLNEEYEDVHAWHNRYKGYHVFLNKSAVENRFLKGGPLSCFCLDGRCNEVHTATESIVLVIVRIETNYRSAHVMPPYAYNFTYSLMY